MNNIKDLYDTITPNESDEAFVNRVMTSEARKKHNGFMRVAVIVPALLLALTVSVGAANNWDYYAVFGSIFGDNAANTQDYTKEPEYEIIKNTFEDFDFAVSGVLGSNDNLMILLDVKAKNGFKFDDNLLYYIDTDISGWENGIFNNTPTSMSSALRTRNETENGFTAMLSINTEADLNGKTLTITSARVGQFEKEIEGELMLKVKVDSNRLPTLTLTPNEYTAINIRAYLLPEKYRITHENNIDEKSNEDAVETSVVVLQKEGIPLELNYTDTVIYVKNLILTPMSLKIEFERTEDEINEEFFYRGDIIPLYLLKADGDKINLHYDDGGIANGSSKGPIYDNNEVIGYRHTFGFEYPIDINEIDSIVIGGLEVPLK